MPRSPGATIHTPPLDRSRLRVGSRRLPVEPLATRHPGGPDYIRAFAGRDATDVFLAYHAHADPERFDTPYAELVRRARAAGLFEATWRRPAHLAAHLALWVAGAWLCQIHPAFAGLLGVAVMHLHYIHHDVLHGQWIPDRDRARRFSWGFTLLAGYTPSWWERREHDPHHVFCNRFPDDPDDFLGWPAWILPGLPVVQAYMQWCSLRDGTAWERLLACCHLVLMVGILPGWEGWAFYLLTYGAIWLPFQPLHHTPVVYETDDWVSGQVANTQDIVGLPGIGWLMAGHDKQIEHHLFPTMPRHNLRRAAPLVRAWCAERGLPYRERRFLDAWGAFGRAWFQLHLGDRTREIRSGI